MRSFGAAITTTCVYVFVALAGMAPAHAATDSNLFGDAMAALSTPSTDTSPGRVSIIAVVALVAGFVAFIRFRRRTHARLLELAMTDGLTGLKNRRKLDNDVSQWIGGEARPYGHADDRHRQLQDVQRHPRSRSRRRRPPQSRRCDRRECVRCDDVAYRYGGEEFCVLLPDTTRRRGGRRGRASPPCDRGDRGAVRNEGDRIGRRRERTSTHLPTTAATADAALFRAKHGGRNRIAVDPRSGDIPTTSN